MMMFTDIFCLSTCSTTSSHNFWSSSPYLITSILKLPSPSWPACWPYLVRWTLSPSSRQPPILKKCPHSHEQNSVADTSCATSSRICLLLLTSFTFTVRIKKKNHLGPYALNHYSQTHVVMLHMLHVTPASMTGGHCGKASRGNSPRARQASAVFPQYPRCELRASSKPP